MTDEARHVPTQGPESGPPSPPAGSGHWVNRIAVLTIGLALATVGLFFFAVHATYRTTLIQQIERADLVVMTVENAITRSLESAETALLALAQDICTTGCTDVAGAFSQRLRDTLRFSPHIRQILLVTRDGTIQADSANRSVGQTLDFARLGLDCLADGASDDQRRSFSQGLHLGPEVPGRYLPTREDITPPGPRSILPLVVCLRPGYLAIAALNPAHLRQTLALDALGPSGRVWLARLDGTVLLADRPPADPADDSSLPPPPTLSVLDSLNAGHLRGILPLPETADGFFATRPTVTYRVSQRYPIAVLATTSRADALASWLKTQGTMVFWDGVALFSLLIVGGVLTRESLHRARLEGRVQLLAATQDVFANSAEAMLITDPRGRILSVNPTFVALTGHSPHSVIGRPARRFLVRATAGTLRRADARTLAEAGAAAALPPDPAEDGGRVPQGPGLDGVEADPWVVLCRGGDQRMVEVKTAPLGNDTAVLTLNDITDRLETQRALVEALAQEKRAGQAKTDFLANMSHELRTPLNAIIGFSEVMKGEMMGPLPGAYSEYAGLINASGRHLLEMINQILDLAKIESGKLALDLEPLRPTELMHDVVAILTHQAEARGLTLTDTADCPHTLAIDGMRVRQVFINILGNAIKYTEQGDIRVSSRCDRLGHHFLIEDTGLGMTHAQIVQSLKPFERVHNDPLTRREQGTGLGLPLAQRIMDLHGGSLVIASQPGRGTTVTVSFPQSAPSSARVAGPAATDQAA